MSAKIVTLETALRVTAIAPVLNGILADKASGYFAVVNQLEEDLSVAESITMGTPDSTHITGIENNGTELLYTRTGSGLVFTGHPMTENPFGRTSSRSFGEFIEDVFYGRYASLLGAKEILLDQVNQKIYFTDDDLDVTTGLISDLVILEADKTSSGFFEA